ncbi:hypothetical protein [Mucilaginibacter sp.]|uniref:hypothetical protein n=1 Tax=Mucilaginibacter sp. TaxID=1882438 RepID=UPI003D0DC726
MDSFLIFVALTLFSFSGYIVWPSRYNVVTHGMVAGGFISIIVPALILGVPDNYPPAIVDLYTKVLVLGILFFLPALIIGFVIGRRLPTQFSFDIMTREAYEERAIKVTKIFMVIGVAGLIASYIGMGFMPMFAAEPIAAKLFRGQYQEPYLRVAILFRISFFLISTITPIACIIWYKKRSKLFLFLTSLGLFLMIASLERSGAFGGVVFAFIIVMSFKSRAHFVVLMVILIGIFVLSSFFYYIVGVRHFEGNENVWEVIGRSAPDIDDQMQFMVKFDQKPVWTYGRTMYGGLIPGHYEWNPSVYTLGIIAPGRDVNDVGSGGLRLPLPLWGYVSFQWLGVILFSFFTGLLTGVFIGILKSWVLKYDSIIIRATAIIAFGAVATPIVGFTLMNMFAIPPALIMLFYLYRISWK